MMEHQVSKSGDTELRTRISPEWTEVENTRLLCRDFLEKRGISAEVIDAVSMVSAELLENAIKYGDPEANGGIEYSLDLGRRDITIEVKNLLHGAVWSHLERLDHIVQWIRGFQNPFEAYVRQLREVSEEALSNRESRLGLVRMAYEGQSVLDFYIDQDSTLYVSAVFQNEIS